MCVLCCVVIDDGNEWRAKLTTLELVRRSIPVYKQTRSPIPTYVSTGWWYALLFLSWFRGLNPGPSGDSVLRGTRNPRVTQINNIARPAVQTSLASFLEREGQILIDLVYQKVLKKDIWYVTGWYILPYIIYADNISRGFEWSFKIKQKQ